jgi:hypothetical protein
MQENKQTIKSGKRKTTHERNPPKKREEEKTRAMMALDKKEVRIVCLTISFFSNLPTSPSPSPLCPARFSLAGDDVLLEARLRRGRGVCSCSQYQGMSHIPCLCALNALVAAARGPGNMALLLATHCLLRTGHQEAQDCKKASSVHPLENCLACLLGHALSFKKLTSDNNLRGVPFASQNTLPSSR